MTPNPAPSTFRADIEGLRAIGIALVVAFHAQLPGFGGGYVGVDVFFVLSGYLITRLLVAEAGSTGRIDLLAFYARRARRLLPALAVMLLLTAALVSILYAPFEQRTLAADAAYTAGYVANIAFAHAALDYNGPDAQTNPFLHTWSLSVEEQFYLVWPLLVMLGLGLLLRRSTSALGAGKLLLWLMLLVAAFSFALSCYLTVARQPWAFYLAPPRAWEFAAGALGVILPSLPAAAKLSARFKVFFASRAGNRLPLRPAVVLGWLGLAGIIFAALTFDKTTLFPGVAALLPVLSTLLVLVAAAAPQRASVQTLLGTPPFQFIGRLSYSWYLWHWPVLVLGAALLGPLSLPARLALLALSLLLALASLHWVENPIRYHTRLARQPRQSVMLGLVSTACLIVLCAGWWRASIVWAESPAQTAYTRLQTDFPLIYKMGCGQDFFDTDAKPCVFGPEAAPHTAVLLGDSHAGQWFPAVESVFVPLGWRIVVYTKFACPMVDTPFVLERLGRLYTECDQWRTGALRSVARLHPDITLLSAYDGSYPFPPAQRLDGTMRSLAALSADSGRVLLIRDTPAPGYDLPTCSARLAWRLPFVPGPACMFPARGGESDAIYAQQVKAAALFPNVTTLDMSDMICEPASCPLTREGVLVYRDSDHLSAEFVSLLASRFADRIHLAPGD